MIDLPSEARNLLYSSQQMEISKYLPHPIVLVWLDRADSTWQRLDSMLTGENWVKDITNTEELTITLHQLVPGKYAVWVQEAMLDDEPGREFILINSLDLKSIKDHDGLFGLQLDSFFK